MHACRKDSFVTHRAVCDALAEESARLSAATNAVPILMSSSSTATPPQPLSLQQQQQHHQPIFSLLNQHQQEEQKHDYFQNPPIHISLNTWDPPPPQNPNPNPAILHHNNHIINIKPEAISNNIDLPISNSPFLFYQEPPPPSSSYKNFLMMTSPFHSPPPPASSAAAHLLSATALLQKAATAGAQPAGHVPSAMSRMDLGGLGHVTAGIPPDYQMGNFATWQQRSDHNRGPTRDFLGLTGDRGNGNGNVDVNVNVNVNGRNLLSFTRGVEFPTYVHPLLRTTTHVGFATQDQPPAASQTTWGN